MPEPMRKADAVTGALLVETGIVTVAAAARSRPLLAGSILAAGALAARGAFGRNSPVFGQVVHRGAPDTRRVALTFDDGPGPSTPDVLDALREQDVRATFFVLGRQVVAHPRLVRRMLDEGHEVANHGFDHGILVFRGIRHVVDQIGRTAEAVARAAHPEALTRLFRAPHGFRSPVTAIGARRAGHRMAGWTTGVFDSDQPGAEVIARRAIAALAPGTILLLHDADGWEPTASRAQTAEAIGPICRAAREAGLEPVPMGELIGV